MISTDPFKIARLVIDLDRGATGKNAKESRIHHIHKLTRSSSLVDGLEREMRVSRVRNHQRDSVNEKKEKERAVSATHKTSSVNGERREKNAARCPRSALLFRP